MRDHMRSHAYIHRISSNVVTYSEQQIIPCCVLIGLKDLVDVIRPKM